MGNQCYVPQEGGESVSFAVANPAAGANWTLVLPAGYEYEVRLLQTKLTTAAVVANRTPRFEIYDAAGINLWTVYFTQPCITTETDVFSLFWQCSRADSSLLIAAGNRHYNDGLPTCRLPAGAQIASAFVGLNAADQFTETRILAQRWLTV